MELLVLNDAFQESALIDTFSSLIWTDRYNDAGDFELVTYASPETFSIFQKGYYIWFKDSEHLMYIDKVEITTDAESGNTLVVSGPSLEKYLNRRIVWKQTEVSGNVQNAIKKIVNENIISPTDSARAIPNFIFQESSDEAITSLEFDDTMQYDGDDLFDVISTICQAYSIGFKLVLSNQNEFVLSLYAGADRTYDQTHRPYVVFSPEFENIINSDYIDTDENYKNAALVHGDTDENERRRSVSIGTATGLARREVLIDASDIASTNDEGEYIGNAKYNALLKQRGEEELLNYKNETIVDGQMETTKLFRYNEDFFMGDIVQVENEYGVTYTARITEMIHSQDESGYSNYPSFEIIDLNEGTSRFYASGHKSFVSGETISFYTDFRPGYIAIVTGSASDRRMYVYDQRDSTTQIRYADTSTPDTFKNIENASKTITRIGDRGFTLSDQLVQNELWWFALANNASFSNKYVVGSFEGVNADKQITCGFKPSYVAVYESIGNYMVLIYDADRSQTGFSRATGMDVSAHVNFNSASSKCFRSIDDDGFTMTATTAGKTYYYVAIAGD